MPYSDTLFGILRYVADDQSILNVFKFHGFVSVPTLAVAKSLSQDG